MLSKTFSRSSAAVLRGRHTHSTPVASRARQFHRSPRRTYQTQQLRSPPNNEQPPIIPQFWNGTNAIPERAFVLDCKQLLPRLNSLAEICAPTSDGTTVINTNTNEGELLSSAMHEAYDRVGMVLVRNTGLTSGEHMKAVVLLITDSSTVYQGGANPRSEIPEQNLYDTGAPLVSHIHYHHEMAYVQETVANLGFACISNTKAEKGATFLCHNLGAHDAMMNSSLGLGDKLRDKGVCYIRKLPDRKFFDENPDKADPNLVYNFWQHSFLTEDPDEAAEIAREKKQLHVEWQDSPIFGRYMVTKHYTDAFEYCPAADKNLLYSSLADDNVWFDAWPGVMDLAVDERPLQMTFGDDTPFSRREKEEFVFVYDQFGTRISWQVGDIGIICNMRVLHGRPGIHLDGGESRELGVVLGQTIPKRGIVEGKW